MYVQAVPLVLHRIIWYEVYHKLVAQTSSSTQSEAGCSMVQSTTAAIVVFEWYDIMRVYVRVYIMQRSILLLYSSILRMYKYTKYEVPVYKLIWYLVTPSQSPADHGGKEVRFTLVIGKSSFNRAPLPSRGGGRAEEVWVSVSKSFQLTAVPEI